MNEAPATLTVNNSTFSGDTAPQGGAIYNMGTATIANSNLTTNSGTSGGAIENVGTLTVQGSALSDNSSTSSAGAIGNTSAGILTILGSTFTANSTTGSSSSGGAISSAGVLSISDSTFTGNTAANSGGAVYYTFAADPLDIVDSTFSTNTATSGGAIFTATNTSLDGATFSGNSAGSGGAVDVAGGLTASNATFATNSAGFGGALYSKGTLTFVNTTIAYNQATLAGGGLDVAGGTATLYNTLVANNTAGSATPNDITGTLAAASSNDLVTSAAFAGGLTSDSGDNLVGVAPDIATALASNGGPTATIALLAGSPAIDAGINSLSGVTIPTVDQRGALRGPAGLNAGANVDIGAYEASSSYVVSTTEDTLNSGTLRTGVGWADVSINVNPANLIKSAPNTLVFDTTGTIDLIGGTLALANNGGTTVAKSIEGPGPGMLTISGNNASGVFSVASGVKASITGLTITGGLDANDGGAIDNSGSLSLSNLAVTGNNARIRRRRRQRADGQPDRHEFDLLAKRGQDLRRRDSELRTLWCSQTIRS